jgi:hypothetical protein
VRKQTTSFFFPSFPHQTEERVSLKSKSPSSFALSDQKTQGKNNAHSSLSLAFSSLFEKIKKRERKRAEDLM